jgi:hypothetical protein
MNLDNMRTTGAILGAEHFVEHILLNVLVTEVSRIEIVSTMTKVLC